MKSVTRSVTRKLTRQRGVAVVTALLLTTLAVTIVASLFWQQQVQVRSMENQRLHLQTRWILRGALDWARLILRQDGIDSPNWTRADGVWATPLAETRLDDYVERERVEGETYDATLQGQVVDAQSRYNLKRLAPGGTINAQEVAAFKRLLELLQLDGGLAQSAAQLVQRAAQATLAQQQQGGSNTPMALQRLEDLLAAGFSQQAIDRLRDYVVVLPDDQALVNVNTASAEVIAAIVDTMSLADAQALVADRKRTTYTKNLPFTSSPQVQGKTVLAQVDVRSNYFLVLSQVRLDRARLESWALIRRETQQKLFVTSIEWIREI
ncbi:general secretion pathway protein K [Pseudoduganella flava]|uniref:Type II secretion system protein K n=1 Tax=Pseudoduganella flava TaxID=871742 RepID=A0A562PNU8_9BURK|nr:type II secretion system minor pseudopilin GspK [Pseudoduganella flava]QGZ40688.1 type II secretion system minor pseudopilin GspK [Pseudoduganella flava]TWI46141.1 general secretion pathway protein K [Pseudoduganella flava]